MLNDYLCIWDNKVIFILYCSVLTPNLYYNGLEFFFFSGKGHLGNERKVKKNCLTVFFKNTEMTYLWYTVSICKH